MKPPEKLKRKTFNTTMDPDLLFRLRLLAVALGSDINALLEESIRDLLEKHRDIMPVMPKSKGK